MTPAAAMFATWMIFLVTMLLVGAISHGKLEPPPRWLRPACLTGLAILFAASLVVIWSAVRL